MRNNPITSHTHCQVAPTDPQAKTWQRVCQSQPTTKTTEKPADEKEHRSDNSTYPKVAVRWLNEALYFASSSVVADSLVLRNRHLRVAATRYRVFKK